MPHLFLALHPSDFDALNEEDSAKNNQLAFDIAEREFGIQPVTTGKEMALDQDPDKLMMVLYISKLYEMFRNSPASITGRLLFWVILSHL